MEVKVRDAWRVVGKQWAIFLRKLIMFVESIPYSIRALQRLLRLHCARLCISLDAFAALSAASGNIQMNF